MACMYSTRVCVCARPLSMDMKPLEPTRKAKHSSRSLHCTPCVALRGVRDVAMASFDMASPEPDKTTSKPIGLQ